MMTTEARKRLADKEKARRESVDTGGARGVDDDSGILGEPWAPTSVLLDAGQDSDGEGSTTEAEFLMNPMITHRKVVKSEEVRVTATSGGQKGSKPARFDLIPTDALELLARHYGKGAEKYDRVNGLDNWRNGYEWSLSYAAMQRHLNSFWSGEDYDEETGSLHLVAAAWHCFTLIHFVNHPDLPEEYDDRQDVLDGSRHR